MLPKWLPQTLFARLALALLLTVLLTIALAAWLFRDDRARLIAENFTETRLSQIESIRQALQAVPTSSLVPEAPRVPGPGGLAGARLLDPALIAIQQQARSFGFFIVPVDRRPDIGMPLHGPALRKLGDRLRERFGGDLEVRFGRRMEQPVVWLRLRVGNEGSRSVWLGVPIRSSDAGELPRRLWIALAVVIALMLVLAYAFARWLSAPLERMAAAVSAVGRGQTASRLPERGPREIVQVARAVNRLAEDLAQIEAHRRTMLAGISHDIRTPLARLRLATEMAVVDPAQRQAIASDIDDIDRIIRQFLDFARADAEDPAATIELAEAVTEVVEKARARGWELSWQAPPEAVPVRLSVAACERMLMNLIDNAHQHGAPPIEIHLRGREREAELEVLDRGVGIAPDDAERLKQPFVRGEAARTDALGTGLGLAIVERLARQAGGSLELLPRAGGGTVARIRLPLAEST